MVWFVNLWTLKSSFDLDYYFYYFTNHSKCCAGNSTYSRTEEILRDSVWRPAREKRWEEMTVILATPPFQSEKSPSHHRGEWWRSDWRLKVSYSFKQTSDRALFFVLQKRVRAGEASVASQRRGSAGCRGWTRRGGVTLLRASTLSRHTPQASSLAFLMPCLRMQEEKSRELSSGWRRKERRKDVLIFLQEVPNRDASDPIFQTHTNNVEVPMSKATKYIVTITVSTGVGLFLATTLFYLTV